MNSPEAVLAAGWFVARDVAPLGAGHIHDTFRATDARGARFVLQRINDRVFADPVQVMHNVMRVTAHTSAHAPGLTPVLVRSRSGDGFHTDERGRVWRLWEEVGDCRVVSQVTQTALAEAAGFAFGRFQQVLADLPQPPLAPVIPGFHELEKVLLRFDHVAAAERTDRGKDAAFVDRHRDLAQHLSDPTGHIHGDCKLSNLLFDGSRSEVRCVLDLDTVMLGHWAWDYGDLVRSVLTATRPDMWPQAFAAVTRGFLTGSGIRATAGELTAAPRYMTFMLGVRYLTDHLDDDTYFKVAARGDNLQRARRQFALLESIEAAVTGLRGALTGIEGVLK